MTTTRIQTDRDREIVVSIDGDAANADRFITVTDTNAYIMQRTSIFSGLTVDEATRLAKALLGLPEDAVIGEILTIDEPEIPLDPIDLGVADDISTPQTRTFALGAAVRAYTEILSAADAANMAVDSTTGDDDAVTAVLRLATFVEYAETKESN